LISIAATAAIMVWHAYIKTNGDLIALKLLQGFVGAPVESLPEISLTDIYCQHERGTYIALYGLVLYSGIYFMTIIAGFIYDGQNWQWVLVSASSSVLVCLCRLLKYWCAIFNAASFVILFFFMEETNYQRKAPAEAIEDDLAVSPTQRQSSTYEKAVQHIELATRETRDYPRTTHLQKLRLLRAKDLKKPNRLWSMVKPPLQFMTYPVIFYSGFCYGLVIVWWNVLINTVSPMLSAAPYNFSAKSVGLAYFAVWLGTFIGWHGIGVVDDKFLLWMARRNGGISEPENRQWLSAVNLVLFPAFLLLWGVGAAHGIHWFGLMVGLCISGIYLTIGLLQLSIAYCLDSYKDFGPDAFVTVIIIRNTMNFAADYGIPHWLKMGTQNAFIVAGLAQTASFLLAVKFGKGFRRRSTARYHKHVQQIKEDS
jgi:hypothetical protein